MIVAASGYNLKDVLKIIDGIDFLNQDDIHTVSRVYESLLRRLGNENKMAGEFYTPRPVIRLVVNLTAPKLGETIYDPATGAPRGAIKQYLKGESVRKVGSMPQYC